MTRLLIRLRATDDSRYETEYHKDIQGLIYSLLRGSGYDNHNKQGYKFFTFSNIFPFSDMRKNDQRNLMISSPNNDFVSYVKEQLAYLKDIRIGQMKFKVDYCNKLDIKLPEYDTFSLITGTPIITRIHRYKYEEAGALELVNGYKSIYWRNGHPVDLFINQLEDNLVKKYNEYHHRPEDDESGERGPVFYSYKFLKQIATKVSPGIGLQKATIIGTNWQFLLNGVSELVRFALDTGLGELNSLGFGFMNVKRAEVRRRPQCNINN
jgi:CRISPR-associated endoribonuclease Cas6